MAVPSGRPEIAAMFTMVEDRPLVPVRDHSARWACGIPVHPGHSAEAGRALADTLGNCSAALAPGAVVVAENAPPLLADAVHFEENTQALRVATSLGIVRPLTGAFNSRFDRSAHVAKLWGYCVGRASRRHASKFPERRKRNWSGRRESNPRRKLGKLLLCH